MKKIEFSFAEVLNMISIGDKGRKGSLKNLAFIAGENREDGEENIYKEIKSANKDSVLAALTEYYQTPGRFQKIWAKITPAERKILSYFIWSKGSADSVLAEEVAKEFGVNSVKSEISTYISSYFIYRNGLRHFLEKYVGESSAFRLFFPEIYGYEKNFIFFYQEIKREVGEMERNYSAADEIIKGKYLSREDRTGDFVNIIRCCNSNKITVTKAGIPNKSAAFKLRDFCGYEEFSAAARSKPEDERTVQRFLITLPLFLLGTAGGLISVFEGACVPGPNAAEAADFSPEELAERLFSLYIKSKAINETEYMAGIKSARGHRPADARKNFIGELKKCPLGVGIYTKELERNLKLAAFDFARTESQHVLSADGSNYEYAAEWEEYEKPLINLFLVFLFALGAVDVCWGEKTGLRIPEIFRINKLGAYVLGLTEEYSAPETKKMKQAGGFTVLPDYSIIIPESKSRTKHELFFERVFTKVSATEEAAVYRLDFETAARAMNCGIGISGLKSYLEGSEKPLPDNVKKALEDWEKQSKRIKIRQVTVIECEDEALLEEVIRYKGMGGLVREKLSAAAVIDGGAKGDVKKIIEKNKRFCGAGI